MIKETIIVLVKPGDTVEITPIPKVPNAERRFKVDKVLDNGFLVFCFDCAEKRNDQSSQKRD